MSAEQIIDYDCRVILDPDFCYIQNCHTGHLVGTDPGAVTHLWKLDWLRLPSTTPVSLARPVVVASSTSSFSQWHHRLGHLCTRLSTLLRQGLLGPISDQESLDQCQGCRLGKQI
jgi:hypothetical protein